MAGVTSVTFYNNISKQYGGGMDIVVNVTNGVETCTLGLGLILTILRGVVSSCHPAQTVLASCSLLCSTLFVLIGACNPTW